MMSVHLPEALQGQLQTRCGVGEVGPPLVGVDALIGRGGHPAFGHEEVGAGALEDEVVAQEDGE